MEKGKVSIIIPVYNKEKYIAQTLNSVKNQSYTNLEVIVIDDKSTDKSVELVSKFAETDKRFRLIKNEQNMGVSQTRNRGMEWADGEWIFFLDADDVIHKRALEIMVNCMTKNNAEIVYCKSSGFEESFEETEIKTTELDKLIYAAPNTVKVDLRVLVSSELIHRNKIQFPSGINNGEDTIFSTLICGYTDRIMDIQYPLYGWRRYVSNSLSRGQWNNPQMELPRELGILKYMLQSMAADDMPRLKGRKINFIRSKKNAIYGIMTSNGIDYRNNKGIQLDSRIMKKSVPVSYIMGSDLSEKQKIIMIISQFPVLNSFAIWKLIYRLKKK